MSNLRPPTALSPFIESFFAKKNQIHHAPASGFNASLTPSVQRLLSGPKIEWLRGGRGPRLRRVE
jgi:hypothetical protein